MDRLPGHLEGCAGGSDCSCLRRLRETPFKDRPSPMRDADIDDEDTVDGRSPIDEPLVSTRQTRDFCRIVMDLCDPGQCAAFLECVAQRIRKQGRVTITIE